jgi:hypothetical protein
VQEMQPLLAVRQQVMQLLEEARTAKLVFFTKFSVTLISGQLTLRS